MRHPQSNDGYVSGDRLEDYNERKGWYREGKHGRKVEVGDIWVEKVQKQQQAEQEWSEERRGKGREADVPHECCHQRRGYLP